MANVFKKLKTLQNNIFSKINGGGGVGNETRPPASKVQDIGMQPSPTGVLEDDPFRFSTMSYPLDVQNSFQNGHYMLFYVNRQHATKYKYEDADIINVNEFAGNLKGASTGESRYQKLKAIKQGTREVGAKNAGPGNESRGEAKTRYNPHTDDGTSLTSEKQYDNLGVSSAFNKTVRITDSVSMYLPPNVEESTTATYSDSATGLAGFLISSFGDGLKNMDAEAITRKLAGSLEGIAKDLTFKAIGVAGELAGAEGADKLAKKFFGEADNPYMEVLFDTMQLRTFTYNFVFAPRNEEEAYEVQKIIQLFRFHMAPELRPGANRYLGIPSQFDIHYMYLTAEGAASENNFYNRIATCVLQDCKVNYTPNGVKSFEDGGPVTTTMTLQFKEIELLTKDKIAQGY